MTRALWVTGEVPGPDLGGGSIRQAHLLSALAQRVETQAVVVGRIEDPQLRSVLAGVVELSPVPLLQPKGRARRRLLDVWHGAFAAAPRDVRATVGARRALTGAVGEVADDYDVVCVEHGWLAPLLPARRRTHWALTFHHVPSVELAQAAALAHRARLRWLWERERRKAVAHERWAVTAYDTVIAVSAEDARVLGPGVAVVPNGVDIQRFSQMPLPSEPRLVFSGTLDYGPNVDGVLWFCRDVLPRLRRLVPEVTLDVVGRRPVAEVRGLGAQPGIAVHADVPSVIPYLEAARAAVVPLRLGSGSRLKALEAMAAGRPVVGTAVGLGGLAYEAGRHALVADDGDAMARALMAVCTDAAVAHRLAREGRALVEQRYDWTRIGGDFTSLLLERTSGRGRHRRRAGGG